MRRAAFAVLAAACAVAHPAEAERIGPDLPGYRGQNGPARAVDMFGWRVEFALDGAALMLARLARPGARGRVTVEARADADGRVVLAVIADSQCRVRGARRLRRGPGGAPAAIDILDSRLEPTGESLPVDPPPPPAPEAAGDGPLVALVDTGVNYLLPEIAARLARGADGAPLGYDYWDLDPRPFDSDPVRSPLFPARHGTRTASLLLRESPAARLAPYRYPRPDMDRMADLVADAARIGARVVNLSLASSDRGRWRAYEAAARRNPQILFVAAAGNRRRDLDLDPMYPAALGLANQLVVTAATAAPRGACPAHRGRRNAPGAPARFPQERGRPARLARGVLRRPWMGCRTVGRSPAPRSASMNAGTWHQGSTAWWRLGGPQGHIEGGERVVAAEAGGHDPPQRRIDALAHAPRCHGFRAPDRGEHGRHFRRDDGVDRALAQAREHMVVERPAPLALALATICPRGTAGLDDLLSGLAEGRDDTPALGTRIAAGARGLAVLADALPRFGERRQIARAEPEIAALAEDDWTLDPPARAGRTATGIGPFPSL